LALGMATRYEVRGIAQNLPKEITLDIHPTPQL
jgi:hypothetical protein